MAITANNLPALVCTSHTDNQTVAGVINISCNVATGTFPILYGRISFDGAYPEHKLDSVSNWMYALDTKTLSNGIHQVDIKVTDEWQQTTALAFKLNVQN